MATTNLKVTDESIDQMMMNAPIKISDCASMFRRQISKNERPMERSVLTQNNRLVDEWYEKVLKNLADREGTIKVMRVNPCFQYFYEGYETKSFQKYRNYLPKYDEETVMFWIKFFLTNDIEKIHEAGISVVSAAWGIITGALRTHFVDKRWEAVYSQSDDPLMWDKLANSNPHVMNGRPLPYGLMPDDLANIEQIVRVVINNPIRPK